MKSKPLTEHELSVMARLDALEGVIQGKRKATHALIQGCCSTVKFATLDDPDTGITPLGSRNTLFKHADRLLGDRVGENGERGWAYLNSLRIAVHEKGNAQRESTAKLKRTDQLSSLKRHLNETQALMLAQSTAYVSLIARVSAIAHLTDIDPLISKRLLNLLNDHDETFGDLFTPGVVQRTRPDNVRGINGDS
jgi:hypothetical protein